jgi:hypothetical protein
MTEQAGRIVQRVLSAPAAAVRTRALKTPWDDGATHIVLSPLELDFDW